MAAEAFGITTRIDENARASTPIIFDSGLYDLIEELK